MSVLILTCISMVSYFLLAFAGWRHIVKVSGESTRLMSLYAFMNITLHAYLLYLWIDLDGGQNLSFVNVFSQMAWLLALFVCVLNIFRDSAYLQLVAYPLAAISIGVAFVFPQKQIMATAENPLELLHIVLAIVSFSVVCMAGLQAVLVMIEERLLRSKKMHFYLQAFPPLQSMELFLFQLIWLAFIMLTLLLLSSLAFYHVLWGAFAISKMMASLLTWLLFVMLLFGRYFFGWRGKMATRLTIILVILFTAILVISLFWI